MNSATPEPGKTPETILTDHFTTLCSAPDGVKKLRELILTLAVQGRLVPQNLADEPASVLLERIQEEKECLVTEGKIKKQKALPPIDPEEVPFEVPEGWMWTRMGEIGSWSTGGTPSRRISEYFGGEIRWIKSGDLNDSILYEVDETISKRGLENSNAKLLPIGSVSVALYGATIGKTSILGVEATTNQACANCIPFHKFLYNRYLLYYILEERKNLNRAGQGGAQPNLTNKIIHEWYLPLPPIAEQHRIVERVDALMALCDELEERISRQQDVAGKLTEAICARTGGI